jgi:hypothetical protein
VKLEAARALAKEAQRVVPESKQPEYDYSRFLADYVLGLADEVERLRFQVETDAALWRGLSEGASELWARGSVKKHALLNAKRCDRVLATSREEES